jgi:hypothetical protein
MPILSHKKIKKEGVVNPYWWLLTSRRIKIAWGEIHEKYKSVTSSSDEAI